MYISNTLLDLVSNLPLDNIGEALIASCLAVLVWFVAKMKHKVQTELSPNGGSSTKDVLLRLEKKLISIEHEMAFRTATFRFLYTTAKYCGFRTNNLGMNTMVTDDFCEYVGINESDLMGLNWLNLVPIEYEGVLWRDRIRAEFEVCLALQKTYKMIHPIYVKRQGKKEIRMISTTAYPVIDGDTLIGTVGGFKEYLDDNY